MAGLEDPRMGTTRASMKTNVLLAKSELGKVQAALCANSFSVGSCRPPYQNAQDARFLLGSKIPPVPLTTSAFTHLHTCNCHFDCCKTG